MRLGIKRCLTVYCEWSGDCEPWGSADRTETARVVGACVDGDFALAHGLLKSQDWTSDDGGNCSMEDAAPKSIYNALRRTARRMGIKCARTKP